MKHNKFIIATTSFLVACSTFALSGCDVVKKGELNSLSQSSVSGSSISVEKTSGTHGQSSVENSNSTSSAKSSEQQTSVTELNFADRSQYSLDNLFGGYYSLTIGDVIKISNKQETLPTVGEGYKIGDVFNGVLDYYSQLSGMGVDFKASYGFSLCENGVWYKTSTNLKTHKIANQFLNCNLVGLKNFNLSESDLSVYGNTPISQILGFSSESLANIQAGSGVCFKLINATVSEWSTFLSNNEDEAISALLNVAGDVKIFENSKTGDEESFENFNLTAEQANKLESLKSQYSSKIENLTFAELITAFVAQKALGENYELAKLVYLWSESQTENISLNELITVDGKAYSVKEAISCFNNLKNVKVSENFDEHLKNLYSTLNVEKFKNILPSVKQFLTETYSEKATENLTVGEVSFLIATSENKTQTINELYFDIIDYYFTKSSCSSTVNSSVSAKKSGLEIIKDEKVITFLNKIFSQIKQANASGDSVADAFITKENLREFALILLENSEEGINKIYKANSNPGNYAWNFDPAQYTLTYEKVYEYYTNNKNTSGFTEQDVGCIKGYYLVDLINGNMYRSSVKIGGESTRIFFSDLLNVSLYDCVYGSSTSTGSDWTNQQLEKAKKDFYKIKLIDFLG